MSGAGVRAARAGVLALAGLIGGERAAAFSVFTHEAIIDQAWADAIVPALRLRFPAAEPTCLDEARRYAYGGAIVADAGYFPRGTRLASDLIHYVRTGDFISALLREASDLDETAFALGALAHYVSDAVGHQHGTNRVVPMAFPKLRSRFGDVVTYADHARSHIRVEMGLDALEAARRGWLPRDFDAFFDFAVSRGLLERAFVATYGVELRRLSPGYDSAIGTFRFAVTQVLPLLLKSKIKSATESHTPTRYHYPRKTFEQRFGKSYQRPGLLARIVAFVIRKLGLGLDPRLPPPEGEPVYLEAIARAVSSYRELIAQVSAGDLRLANLNLDTGHPVEAGEYSLLDRAHTLLLHAVDREGFAQVTPELRAELLRFHDSHSAADAARAPRARWRRDRAARERLRQHTSRTQDPDGPVSPLTSGAPVSTPPRLRSSLAWAASLP